MFSWSYRAVTPDAARLFRLLALHPGPDLSVPAAAALAGLPPAGVRPLLEELARASLVVQHPAGRYSFHHLLRAYATDLTHQVDAGADRRIAVRQMLDHYLRSAYAADRLLYPARDPLTLPPDPPGAAPERPSDEQAALAWFAAEHRVLLAAVHQALGLYGDDGDRAGQAHAHLNLAYVMERQGRQREALNHSQRALDLYRRAGHERGRAIALNAVGWCHALLGEYEQARARCQEALPLLVELGDRNGQADTWDSLGYAHEHLGKHGEAIACYRHAVELVRRLGDHYREATTLINLGEAQQASGDPWAARDTWRQALAILERLHHPDAAQVRGRLAVLGVPYMECVSR